MVSSLAAIASLLLAGPVALGADPAPASSPAPIRLEDALGEARAHNPELRAAEAEARAAGFALGPAGALDDPMLMIQAWNVPTDFANAPIMTQLFQDVPLGGKLRLRREAASAKSDAAAADLESTRLRIDAEVQKVWADLFLAEQTEAINREMEKTAHALVSAAATRVASGRGQQVETLRAQAEILAIQGNEDVADANRLSAAARLAALLDRDGGASTIGPAEIPSPLASLPSLEDLQARALRERPELAAMRASIAAAEAERGLAKAERVPDLRVSAGEMHVFGRDVPASMADSLMGSVSVTLPVFGRSKNRPRIARANAMLEAAHARQRALEQSIRAEVAGAYASLDAEHHLIELHHKLVPLARQTLDSAMSGYAAGRVDFPMVVDSERDLQMHELDLAMHLAAYEKHLADLRRATNSDPRLRSASSPTDEDEQP